MTRELMHDTVQEFLFCHMPQMLEDPAIVDGFCFFGLCLWNEFREDAATACEAVVIDERWKHLCACYCDQLHRN